MKKIFSVLAIILCIATLTACGSNGLYASGRSGYTPMNAVSGITFDYISTSGRNATAVTNISEEMDFELNQTYFYKDNGDSYFLFNMSDIVCVVQKGTSFNFQSAENKKEALENNNILGVWFTTPKKKFQYSDDDGKGIYKLIGTTQAQVSLTSNIYNDFIGKIAVISDGNTEWAMFIGVVGSDYDLLSSEEKDAIEYMAASLNISEMTPEVEPSNPPVSLGGAENAETEETKEDASEDVIEDEIPVTEELEETEITEDTETEITDIEVTEETEVIETDEATNTETDKTEIETEVVEVIEEPTATPVATESPVIEETEVIEATPTPTPITRESTIKLNNQKTTAKDDNTIYDTSIYDMLTVGKRGLATVYTGSENENVVIKADELITGNEAIELIRRYYNDGTLKGTYFDAPDGCSFNVIHYTVDNPIGYVNVKFKGVDGENLVFRGIRYASITYDIKISDTEYYAYYVVPNGCKEYALEIGEGTVDNGLKAAYYHIIK